MEQFTPDACRQVGDEVRLPPQVVRAFAKTPGPSRAEREAEPIATGMLALLADHGVPFTDELIAAAGDLALAAVLTRLHR